MITTPPKLDNKPPLTRTCTGTCSTPPRPALRRQSQPSPQIADPVQSFSIRVVALGRRWVVEAGRVCARMGWEMG